MSNLDSFEEMMTSLNLAIVTIDQPHPVSPSPGQLYAAQCSADGRWCRAVVIASSESNTVSVCVVGHMTYLLAPPSTGDGRVC